MLYLCKKLANALNYKLAHFIGSLLPFIIGSAIMCVIIFFFQVWSDRSIVSFLISILIGIIAYSIAVYEIDKIFNYCLKSNLTQLLKGLKVRTKYE